MSVDNNEADLVASENAVAASSSDAARVLRPLRDPGEVLRMEEHRTRAQQVLVGDAAYLAHAHAVIAVAAERARSVHSGTRPFVADKLFTASEVRVVELAVVVAERAGIAGVAPAYAMLADVVVAPTAARSAPSQAMAYAVSRAVATAPSRAGIAAVADASHRARHAALRKRLGKLRDELLAAHGGDPGHLGLDAAGRLVLDLGARAVVVRVRRDGRLGVREVADDGLPTGAERTSLPPSRAADDDDLVATAKQQIAALRSTVSAVAKGLRRQWDAAMVDNHVWSAAEHRVAIAAHPVVAPLAEGLVWRLDAPGAASTLVRTGEIGEYLDVAGEAHAVPAEAVVRLPHPLELSADERAAWRAHLAEHDLVQPVEQIDRAVFGPDPAGAPTLPSGRVHGAALVSLLERHGWRRGLDDAVRGHLWRPFAAHGVAVVLVVDPGLVTGALHLSDPQRVDRLVLQPLDRPDAWETSSRGWGEVDAVVVSEVRRSLAAIAEKGAT